MADNTNSNGSSDSLNNGQVPAASIWATVNTSTTENVVRMEITKSDDYDRIVKEIKIAHKARQV